MTITVVVSQRPEPATRKSCQRRYKLIATYSEPEIKLEEIDIEKLSNKYREEKRGIPNTKVLINTETEEINTNNYNM